MPYEHACLEGTDPPTGINRLGSYSSGAKRPVCGKNAATTRRASRCTLMPNMMANMLVLVSTSRLTSPSHLVAKTASPLCSARTAICTAQCNADGSCTAAD